jgi:hypothetical protein
MLSLKIFLTVTLLQILAVATPIAPRQVLTLFPVEGGGDGILNTPTGGPASIYTEFEGEPSSEIEQEFENEVDFEKL